MNGSPNTSQHLKIERIRVRRGAIDFRVFIVIDALYVSEEQAHRVLELFPNLRNHICINGKGETFGEEIVGTELAHLFEHLIIELQGRESSVKARFTGHTSWLDELAHTAPQGYALMRTTVTFADDFVALKAAQDAIDIIEQTIGS